MPARILIALLAALVLVAPAYAKRDTLKVVVAEPYIEMHTGPGRGYPVFHVADRGAQIEVLKRRTDWYEVRTDRGVTGWVRDAQLAQTLHVTLLGGSRMKVGRMKVGWLKVGWKSHGRRIGIRSAPAGRRPTLSSPARR